MKIEKIEVIKLNIPLKEPVIISLGAIYKTENLLENLPSKMQGAQQAR